jgi:hypothetical protein
MTGVQHHLPAVDDAAALGRALVEVDPRLVRQPTGLARRWWKGGEPYLTITVDADADGLVFVEVCLRGRFARRRLRGALETGHTDELVLSTGMPKARLEMIDGERRDVVDVAGAVLEGAGLVVELAWLNER